MASTRNSSSLVLPPVDLNQRIGVLTRREVEGRLLAPLLAGLGREFGAERVLRVTRAAIVAIARRQGPELAKAMGGSSLATFRESLIHWTKGLAAMAD